LEECKKPRGQEAEREKSREEKDKKYEKNREKIETHHPPGILRLMRSDFKKPLNIGSDEMVSMNGMAELAMSFDNKKLGLKHIPGPEGVRGRNSDNTLIKQVRIQFLPKTLNNPRTANNDKISTH